MSEQDIPSDNRKLSEAEKQQIKLTAGYFNGVAAVLSLCSLVLSPDIHLHARRRLRGLDARLRSFSMCLLP